MLNNHALLGSCIIAVATVAQPVQFIHLIPNEDGTAQMVEAGHNVWQSRSGDTDLWDSWSPASYGGQSYPHGHYRVGSSEFGEICHGVPGAAGWLSGLGFSFYNFSETSNLTRMRFTLNLYSAGGDPISTVSFLTNGTLRPGVQYLMLIDDNSLTGDYGRIPQDFILTLQYSDFVGISVDDAGILYGGPFTAGSSPDFSLNRTTGEHVTLPSSYHSMMYVHTDTIPAPGGAAFISSLALVSLRRRR